MVNEGWNYEMENISKINLKLKWVICTTVNLSMGG